MFPIYLGQGPPDFTTAAASSCLNWVERPSFSLPEAPRVSERVKLSEDGPYGIEEEAHPNIHGRVPRARRSAGATPGRTGRPLRP